MASKLPPRMFTALSKSTRRRPTCFHVSSAPALNPCSIPDQRNESTSSPASSGEMDVERAPRPRWQYTPPTMVAPVRSSAKKQPPEIWINRDPSNLDEVYNGFLGPGGDKMLSDEVKWLAVTHKSFDHGRRGFNDRLAYLGRRIVELQTSLVLVQSAAEDPIPPVHDPHNRIPFHHPALEGLEALNQKGKDAFTDKKRLAQLAELYGLKKVIRWKPKKADNLIGSGLESVLAQTVYAIVGAISLEKGGDVANKVVRDKILAPLGLGRSHYTSISPLADTLAAT